MKVSNFQFWKGAMIAMAAVVVAVGIFSAGIAHADMASSTNCTLSASDFETALQNGSISYTNIALTSSTASITITNNTGCNAPISLASYQVYVTPGQPQWLSTQQFLNAASASIAASSTQTLTVPVASCMTQVDAWYGAAPTSLLDSNPYGYSNVPFTFTWVFTPTHLCSNTPPPTPTSTPSTNADIAITKIVDDATPHEGDTVNYTLTVSALGPATSTGVVATDPLPSGLTFENATATVGSYATSTGTWTIGDLAASLTATLDIAAQVASGTAGQTIANTAIVGESASSTDNNLSNNSSTVTITVQSNGGCGCGGGGTPTSSILAVNVSGLNASDTAQIGVSDFTASTTQATSTGNGVTPFVLPTGDNYAVTATTTAPNYSVATSTGCAGTISGGTICDVIFTLASSTPTSTNPGGGGTPATSMLTVIVNGLNASDTAALSVADLTASTTQATSTGNGSSTFVLPTNDHYAVTATTTAANAGTYVEATSTGCAGTLSTAMTCNVTFTFTPTPTSTIPSTDADISIAKTVDNENPAPGDNVTYTITVADAGPATSTNVSAQDILPGGLSLVSATASVGAYDMSTGDWTIGNVSPNATATLVIVANVAGNTAGQTITNMATVTQLSSIVDQNPSNNSSSVSITVQTPGGGGGCTSNCGGGGGGGGGEQTAQLQVAKTVDNANPNPGDTIHYTITVSALGPSESQDVVASDTLPTDVTFVSASSSTGTYDSTTGTWNVGDVVEGSSQTLVITATVNSTDAIGETITNTATTKESTNLNNPIAVDNTASVTITVGGSNGGGGGNGGGGSVSVPGGGGSGGGGGNGGGQVLGASASCGIYLDQYIHPIRKDLNDPTEVVKLQKFLNMNLGTNLPFTGYYGPQTIAAVDQFQVKYHIEVLQPWLNYGLPTEYTPTDYVYKTTQRWINLIMCSSLNLPVPQLP